MFICYGLTNKRKIAVLYLLYSTSVSVKHLCLSFSVINYFILKRKRKLKELITISTFTCNEVKVWPLVTMSCGLFIVCLLVCLCLFCKGVLNNYVA